MTPKQKKKRIEKKKDENCENQKNSKLNYFDSSGFKIIWHLWCKYDLRIKFLKIAFGSIFCKRIWKHKLKVELEVKN